MDAKKVLVVLRDAASHFHGNGIRPHSDFVALIAEAEHEAQEPGENDWQSTVGMFAGDAEMQAISEETRSVREAHKVEEPGGWKPGTEPPSDYREVEVRMKAWHDDGRWFSNASVALVQEDVLGWHDLPPLPEETP